MGDYWPVLRRECCSHNIIARFAFKVSAGANPRTCLNSLSHVALLQQKSSVHYSYTQKDLQHSFRQYSNWGKAEGFTLTPAGAGFVVVVILTPLGRRAPPPARADVTVLGLVGRVYPCNLPLIYQVNQIQVGLLFTCKWQETQVIIDLALTTWLEKVHLRVQTIKGLLAQETGLCGRVCFW